MNKKKIIYVLLLFAFSLAFAIFIFPTEKQFEYSYTLGTQWLYDDLNAPFDFAICRTDEEISAEKDSIKKAFIPFYSLDTIFSERHIKTFDDLLRKHSKEKILLNEDANFDQKVLEDFYLSINDELRRIYDKGIILYEKDSSNDKGIIRLEKNYVSELEFVDDFYTDRSAKNRLITFYNKHTDVYLKDSLTGFSLREAIEKSNFVPNVRLNKDLNTKFLNSRLEAVSPMIGMVHKGELIISKNKIIDSETLRILDSYKHQFENSPYKSSFWLVELGVTIVFFILFLVIFLYVWLWGKHKVHKLKDNIFFLSQMLIVFLVAYLVFNHSTLSINVVPYVLVPLLLVTFIEFHVSFLIYFIAIFVLSFFAANRFEFVFIQTITGLIGMLSLKSTAKRKQIFISMIVVFASYSLLHAGFSLMRLGTFTQAELKEFIYYGISSALILLYLPFVFIYEKIFGFISGFTLIELCDTNNPALRTISEKAPGTFQHSVMLSNIVESIVRELDGNYLLARAGALYHDLGKTYAPEYFIENQSDGKNIHANFSYEESAEKIIAHVTKGEELAKKYKLPIQIIDFIKQHHGTSVTRYFYNSWINANPDKKPDISKFQYQGPKPQSIELIAMMMADAVEAASRTLKVYSHESISNLVNNIVESQFKDGQYDEVEITMKQLGVAKKILVQKIENIYHSRIEYPELSNKASK